MGHQRERGGDARDHERDTTGRGVFVGIERTHAANTVIGISNELTTDQIGDLAQGHLHG